MTCNPNSFQWIVFLYMYTHIYMLSIMNPVFRIVVCDFYYTWEKWRQDRCTSRLGIRGKTYPFFHCYFVKRLPFKVKASVIGYIICWCRSTVYTIVHISEIIYISNISIILFMFCLYVIYRKLSLHKIVEPYTILVFLFKSNY